MKVGFLLDKESSYYFSNFTSFITTRRINFLSVNFSFSFKFSSFLNATAFLYYSGEYALLNFFSFMKFKPQSYFFGKNLYHRQNTLNTKSSIYISSFMSSLPSLFIAEFFCKNIFSLKKNIFILLESNMHKQTPSAFWDLICPTNIVGENFFLFKNYSGLAAKSLFLRLGVWYS
jgi:hypothetical protein